MITPTNHAECASFLKAMIAAQGIDATVSEEPPLIKTPYTQTPFTCPHRVKLYHAPTTEQIAQWAKDGTS